MKKISLTLSILILGIISNSLIGQVTWALQNNPLGFGETAKVGKVQFVSATEGWISVSNGARLLHTTNAGANWSVVTMNSTDVVFSLSDGNMSFTDGSTGCVLKSFGSGFENASGAVVYKTINGGVNWQRIVLSQDANDLGMQIQFSDTNNGWASIANFTTGTLKIFKTTNAGVSWSMISSGQSLILFNFVNANDGWAINIVQDLNAAPPFKIYRTTNGGASWTTQFNDNTTGKFDAMHFTDQNNGWVVGASGKILHTTNGGTNWNYITNTGITAEYFCSAVFFLNATTGWIAAFVENGYRYVISTKDGGLTWDNQQVPVTDNIFSISFWDVNHGWLTSYMGQIAHYDAPVVIDTIPNFGFENWINNNQPNQWLVRGTTAAKSTDKLDGNYALKLQTNIYLNEPGQINTLPPNGLEGFQPSFPVAKRHTTLNGYYKFSPVNGDSCQFIIFLSKKGYVNPVNPGYGNIVGIGNLCKSSGNTYSPFAVPITYFDNSTIPDSAWISLDAYKEIDFITMTTNLSPLGNSTLYVDNLAFDEFTVSNWKGMVSDAWENPANWSSGVVPSSTTKVFINTGTPNSPVVRSNASCQSLNISAGVNISVATGYTITINGH